MMKHILLSFVALVTITLLVGGAIGYKLYRQELAYTSINTKPQIFQINKGETLQEIAQNLTQNKLIGNSTFFIFYIKIHNLDKNIEAGSYSIPPATTLPQLITLLQKGVFAQDITIKSGNRVEEIAASISLPQDSSFQQSDFIKLAKTPQSFNEPFLQGVSSLEGFLYPDTYQISPDMNAKDIIQMMLDNFNTKVHPSSYGIQNGLTFYQHLILASILEREAKTDTDKRMIADILFRRLAQNTPLGVDAPIQYFLGFSSTEHTWWRQTIYQADLDNNNVYNTRLNAGLPPTPICNIDATTLIDTYTPIANSYYYYLSDNQGIIHYARTEQEHEENIAKYLK